MTFPWKKFVSTAVTLLLGFGAAAFAQSTTDPLKKGFEDPPQSARPRVWWHWMNGNITQEGIKADLEWMHRVGIAGYQNFDAALQTPQVVPKRLAYMTPDWKQAFVYATKLTDQLGMEEAIAGSPGWSETGGPWVPAEHGMKKYVWSETVVKGGQPFNGKLPHPPTNTGAFQNMAIHEQFGGEMQNPPQFYADAAVIAYRRAASDVPIDPEHAKITSSGGSEFDAAVLSDGDLEKTTKIPIPAKGSVSWVQYEFPAPQTIRAISYVTKDPNFIERMMVGTPEKNLEASDDGQNWRPVVSLNGGDAPEHTISFAAVTAKFFRVTFKATAPPPPPAWAEGFDASALGIKIPPPPKDYEVAEMALYAAPRVNRFEEKAAFVPAPDLYGFATPSVDAADAIKKADVVDLTSKMQQDGTLNWTAPDGDWVVLRFGYSLLGITNHPATKEATGLEVDKLDRRFVKDYFEKYLDSYKETVGPELMGKKGIRYVINDSWEAGSQNWTDNMIAQFKKLRGYDPTPWMPVLAGRVVESAEASDRFLWDFRKTIGDLIANEHYGQLEETLHERGMGHYGESHEGGRAFVADGMEVKKFNEIPMSAMWTQTPGVNKEQFGYNADDRESASVAHLYGQNLAAAESLTAAAAPWAWSPATLKPTADQELLNGINRFVIHESAHQPLVDPAKEPGLTLGPFGQWFNRNETWAEQAGAWINYLARSSYLLQQGHFGADLVYFYGEDSNLTAIFNDKSPDIPAGYGFDYINADGLIHELGVSNGQLTTKSGMRYKVLGLDAYSKHMSLPVLRAIYKLAQDGAVIAGAKPADDPSLSDDAAEFSKLNNELFGDGTGVRKVGKGTVYAGQPLAAVFDALQLKPDFDYTKPQKDNELRFVHRKLADGDLYFVDNRGDNEATVDATFRVTGKAPELWRAETGTSEPASFNIADGRTTVPLHLEPWGTVFVVFRKATAEKSHTVPKPTETKVASVEGPWQVAFQSGRGAPPSITMDTLTAWNESSDPGVKYFGGVGTYTKTIQASADWFSKGSHLWLDLGDVKNLAEVSVNGKDLGVVWHAPYRIDVTSALKPGKNDVVITVVNAWVNRFIGDEQPGATKITFADVKPYRAKSPLLPSGLIGPVAVVRSEAK
ncbi:glycosyl hydrolase [Occallatibacter riparius]|uniref:Glycoside hydrolase n=1 Tax=Occallatibacter riparius TaxID=1002689 RepID=A0A9J7BJ23_9BACT|nr:glycosyl hydrolase [Occallatibacter riparius]UWZ82481.1 glycoside hydrolase [Occallatibacter riparius]